MQNQIAMSKEQALAAFVSRKAEIDAMLARLQALSDDHFNYSPDEITWSHVGTLEHYAEPCSASRTQASKRVSTPRNAPDLPPRPDRPARRGSGS